MKSILKISIVFSLIVLSLASCKKYEDGPMFSLRTKKARITGDWTVESMTFNGTDVTSTFQSANPNFVLNINKDGSYHNHGTVEDKGTWKFGEDKDDVYFQSSQAGAEEVPYRILRLKNKELWLRNTASNGDVTVIHYKQ